MFNISYANEFYRGMPNESCIEGGLVTMSTFQISKDIREDGYQECSINWNDDENALNVLLGQKKETGDYQFCYATVLDLSRVKDFLRDHIINNNLKYERQPIENNKYHGNILILGSASKQIKRLIQSGLATIAGANIIENKRIVK